MELTPYVDTVRQGVHDAAALADENSRQVADRLGQALDASTRLALIRALSDAAAEISTELAPGSVELTLNAGEPQFSVTAPREGGEATVIMPQSSARAAGNSSDSAGSDGSDSDPGRAEPGEDAGEESATARISLRLPLSVKERVDRAADAEGVSTNTWLVRAVQEALDPSARSGQARSGTGSWTPPGIGQIFGPDGPFGAHGVFGPNGVFGGDTPPGARGGGDPREWARPERPERPARPERPGKNRGDKTDCSGGGWGNGWGNGRGRVQGWVR